MRREEAEGSEGVRESKGRKKEGKGGRERKGVWPAHFSDASAAYGDNFETA